MKVSLLRITTRGRQGDPPGDRMAEAEALEEGAMLGAAAEVHHKPVKVLELKLEPQAVQPCPLIADKVQLVPVGAEE